MAMKYSVGNFLFKAAHVRLANGGNSINGTERHAVHGTRWHVGRAPPVGLGSWLVAAGLSTPRRR